MVKTIDETLIKVMECYESAYNAKSDIIDSFHDSYDMYVQKTDEDYHVPETSSEIKTILPRLASPFMNTKKSVISVGGRNEDDHQKAEAIEELIAYQFQRAKFPKKIRKFFFNMLIYPIAIMRTYWDKRIGKKIKLNPVYEKQYDELGNELPPDENTPQVAWEQTYEDEVIFDLPNFEVVSPYDFYPDPACQSINEDEPARFVIRTKGLSREEVEELIRSGYYTDGKDKEGRVTNAKEMLAEMSQGTYAEDSDKQTDIQQKGTKQTDSQSGSSVKLKYEIKEYHSRDDLLIVGEDRFVLKNTENPYGYIPFIVNTYSPLPDQLWGEGVPLVVKMQQNTLDDLESERIKQTKFSTVGVFITKKGVMKASDLERLEPGEVVETSEDDVRKAVQNFKFPGPGPDAYQSRELLISEMQNSTGATDYIQGSIDDTMPQQTATEVASKTAQANERFKYNFNCASESVQELAEHFLAMSQRFLRDEITIKVLGQNKMVDFKQISPEDIQGEYDITLVIDPIRADEQKHKMNLNEFIDRVTGTPQFEPHINYRKLLDEYRSVQEIDPDIMFSEEEMQMNQQMQMQAQMQAQMQGGMLNGNAGAGGINSPEGAGGMGGFEPSLGMEPSMQGAFG